MSGCMIHKELIDLDVQVNNTEELFLKTFKKLNDLGYVKSSFYDAIMKRENEYPTGLPTKPYAVAIPHVDSSHINKEFISITRLKETIKCCEMATNDSWLDVKFIFMLGLKRGNSHVELLQVLMDSFQDEQFMNKLLYIKNADECSELIKEIKII